MAARGARLVKKVKKQRQKAKTKHVRVVCPYCRRTVKLNPPARLQQTVSCPNCRRPISAGYVTAAQPTEQGAEPAEAGSSGDEGKPAEGQE